MADNLKFYQRIFLYAGIWNLLTGIPFLLFPAYFLKLSNMPVPSDLIYLHSVTAIHIIFGFAGIIISKRIQESRNLILTWILTKSSTTLVILYHIIFLNGKIMLLGQGFADSIWITLFIIAYRNILKIYKSI